LSFTSDVTDNLSRKDPRPRLRPFLPTDFDVACSIPEGFTLNFGRGGSPFNRAISSFSAAISASFNASIAAC
jgi:hypothetical protein